MTPRQSTPAITAAVTAEGTALARNFLSGEKKIKRLVEQRYGIADPPFARSMNQLLGPPILDGFRSEL